MKKNLLLCCFALFSVSYIFAQDVENTEKKTFQFPKNEFHISWGDPFYTSTMMYYFYDYFYYDQHLSQFDWFQPTAIENKKYAIGSFTLSYFYRLKKWLWLGGTVNTTSTVGGECFDVLTKEPLPYPNETYLGFAPAIRFSYFNREYVTLYSGLAVSFGCAFTTIKDPVKNTKTVRTRLGVQPQFTFFGVSFGNKVFGNIELGIGYKGFGSVGLGYKF